MRINARLDEGSEQKLKTIREITGLSTTEIVKRSLELFASGLESDAYAQNQRILKELGGIWEGPEDGSVNYKKYVMEYLNEKYPDH